jgi:glc operon protein GlcG
MNLSIRTMLQAGLIAAVLAVASNPVVAQPAGKLTLAEALRLIDAARADASAKSLRLSIAVVDARGDLIALARMPDANPATADTAIGKAMLSAFFGQPSAALAPRANTPIFQTLNAETGGRLRFFQGALPIVRNGYTVGAIGASGASAQQDEDSARAALTSVALR